jgi:hypothetical protein
MKRTWQELAEFNWQQFQQLVVFIRAGQLDQARDYIKFCEHNETVHKMHSQIADPVIAPVIEEVADGNLRQSNS